MVVVVESIFFKLDNKNTNVLCIVVFIFKCSVILIKLIILKKKKEEKLSTVKEKIFMQLNKSSLLSDQR